jgi:hypothetical protein
VPNPPVYEWLQREWPEAYRTSISPFFRGLTISSDRCDLTKFATDLYREGESLRAIVHASLSKHAIGLGLRLGTPVWLHPRDIVRLTSRQDLDALCVIVHCLKVNEGSASEVDCAKVAVAWLQQWCADGSAHKDAAKLLVNVLRERVAGLRTILDEGAGWRSMTIDLTEKCYEQLP